MKQPLVLPIVLGVALFGAVLYIVHLQSELSALRDASGRRPAATAARAPASPGAARTLSGDQRQAMLDVLRGEGGPVKKVWFQVERAKSEPAAFAKVLEEVFRDAGWETQTSDSGGLAFKPGLSVLVADEDWPAYASTAYEALQKTGIDVKAARGYRAYYEEQRKEKPGWQGPKLGPEQTYVVIVGPSPAA
jgi:hypothetical protein